MLSRGKFRFEIVYDARFADALGPSPHPVRLSILKDVPGRGQQKRQGGQNPTKAWCAYSFSTSGCKLSESTQDSYLYGCLKIPKLLKLGIE